MSAAVVLYNVGRRWSSELFVALLEKFIRLSRSSAGAIAVQGQSQASPGLFGDARRSAYDSCAYSCAVL